MGNLSRRLVAAKLCEDGNQMKADGNSFPEFILGWTIGGKFTLAQIPFPANIAL
jgi:hypothetical protein